MKVTLPFKDKKISDAELLKLIKEKCVEAERYLLAASLRDFEKNRFKSVFPSAAELDTYRRTSLL